MTFRIEEKLLINFTQLFDFKKWLSKKGYNKLHPDRKIKSLYFENLNNQMYIDSEEGISPRKKIRIRNYPEHKDQNFFLEKKISSPDGRFKEKKIVKNEEIDNLKKFGYFDETYRSCHPKLFVEYTREYFDAKICRLTIDTNIFYTEFNKSNFIKTDPYVAVEIKAKIDTNLDLLMSKFPFQRVRFSKYCRGFDFLFNK
ncbi:VTC domain-containing protein [Candidatus Pelagibacter sp.]|nr:VTC domain-containing protein [Candidatus Pelagibacter sp.]